MTKTNIDKGTEWIFCRNLDGECSGLSKHTKVLEQIPKTIMIHGKEVLGWQVKIVSEKSEGHVDWSESALNDE